MFRDLYKQSIKGRFQLQEERRKKLLEEQKRKRFLLQDLQRDADLSDNRHKTKLCAHGGKLGASRALKDAYGSDYTLQLSEWLRDRPVSLDDWAMVPCPKGQRCLLMATNGRTDMYSKAGRKRMTFHTCLPGDNGQRGSKISTLLDCVYSSDQDTFYVLDALIYGNQELIHCEAQFRFFWLRSKFDECHDLAERGINNEKPLILLERLDMENIENVSEALLRFPFFPNNVPELDGLLFYHKESSYTCGSTPLVGWLFVFMVPDVLGYPVNESYQKPSDYTEPLVYMEEFDAKLACKKQRRFRKHSNSAEMDTTETVNCDEDEYAKFDKTENGSLLALLEAERRLEIDEPADQFLTCDVNGGD
ncbi:snurportin-1-like [Rhagoletis pomonella]|uniref:snurportin-1-like n=1 Tax=Rhagoletis pomonella TaxID=28610 RepID=UPI00177C3391|nr:snurportin-1-like [Rhagoletis pomonella]